MTTTTLPGAVRITQRRPDAGTEGSEPHEAQEAILTYAAEAIEAFILEVSGSSAPIDRWSARRFEHQLREIEAYLRSARSAIHTAKPAAPAAVVPD